MTDDFDHLPDDSSDVRPMQPRGMRPQPPRLAPHTRRPDFRRLADEEFELRTFDTGQFEAIRPEDLAGTTEPEAGPEPADEFVKTTVEPEVNERPRTPPKPLPAVAAPPRAPVQAAARPAPRAHRRRRRRETPRVWLSTLRSLVVVLAAAILVSTIFSLWTRPTFFSEEFRAGLNQVQATQRVINIQATPLPKPIQEIKIGIIAGHSGLPQDASFEVDPGAVCPDGLTELSINEAVAQRVVAALRRDQYTVELLEEFDPRLRGYRADALISIHTNDCSDYGEAGTGYNAASAAARQTTPGADERLLNCLINQYGATTNLPRHFGITTDMTEYHNFGEVSSDTPTAIIEIGYMRLDRTILTENPDLVAQGIANGVRCFLRPDLYGDVTTSAESETGQ
jgi:N-acetylmuramoyl-L-alanine amidase